MTDHMFSSNVTGLLQEDSGPGHPAWAAGIGEHWSITRPEVVFRLAMLGVIRAVRDEASLS